MQEFSELYRKMCEKAERLQCEWTPKEDDYFFERGNYRDGLADIVRQKEMSEKEVKEFKAKYVWLPQEYQMEKIILRALRPPKIRDEALRQYNNKYNKFLEDAKRMKEIENRFKDEVDDIWDVKALMFVMEYKFRSVWDYEKKDWIEIKTSSV